MIVLKIVNIVNSIQPLEKVEPKQLTYYLEKDYTKNCWNCLSTF